MKYSDRPNAYINAQDLEIAIAKATTYGDALKALRDAPSIDIVRCGECKHEQKCRKAVEHITHEPTSVTIGYKLVEWCSYGEREGE